MAATECHARRANKKRRWHLVPIAGAKTINKGKQILALDLFLLHSLNVVSA
jgi:hypothetical protein